MTAPTAAAATTDPKPMPAPIAAPPTTGNIDPTTLPFFEGDFAYVDTETTGIDSEVDRICEIAIVRYRNGVPEVFHTLVDPEMPIPPTASAVNHITDEMIREAKAPVFSEIADKVAEMLAGAVPYAHQRDLDETFVCKALGLVTGAKGWNCTYRLSRHLFPDAPKHGNQVLRYWLKTNPQSAGLGPHRAIDDVFVSLENTFHLWKAAAERGLKTHMDLHALCNSPIDVKSMPFGEHAGKPLTDVPSSYFEWALGRLPGKDGLKDLDEDLRASMERELARPNREPEVVPSDVMTFGQKHNGKLMSAVPLDYLEWMARENPRCSPEVRAGVKLELERRRAEAAVAPASAEQPGDQASTSAASTVAGGVLSDGAGATLSGLKRLVDRGSREEAKLKDIERAANTEASLDSYLRGFASARPEEFRRVAGLVGGRGEGFMLSRLPAPEPAAPAGPGRIKLLSTKSQETDPSYDDVEPPPEVDDRPLAPAPRRPRP